MCLPLLSFIVLVPYRPSCADAASLPARPSRLRARDPDAPDLILSSGRQQAAEQWCRCPGRADHVGHQRLGQLVLHRHRDEAALGAAADGPGLPTRPCRTRPSSTRRSARAGRSSCVRPVPVRRLTSSTTTRRRRSSSRPRRRRRLVARPASSSPGARLGAGASGTVRLAAGPAFERGSLVLAGLASCLAF
jgi:hypothetical protein